MPRIENPISWLRSKRAISDNPISWLSPKGHYAKFEETVSGLSDEKLQKEKARYGHLHRKDLTITGLAVAAEVGGAAILVPHVDPRVMLFSVGPAAIAACFVGITRGIFIRGREKEILQEEIVKRQGVTGEVIFSASERT